MCGNVVNVKVPPIWREGYCINKGNSYMRVRAAAWRAERWGKRGGREEPRHVQELVPGPLASNIHGLCRGQQLWCVIHSK